MNSVTGESIIQTLIKLLEEQEQIKITYTLERKEEQKSGKMDD